MTPARVVLRTPGVVIVAAMLSMVGCRRSPPIPPVPEPIVQDPQADDATADCTDADDCYARGIALLDQDPEAARPLLASSCEQGHQAACTGLAVVLVATNEDLPRARDLLEAACEADEGTGCLYLGALHYEGTLGAAEPQTALALFERGCGLEVAPACFNAAVLQTQIDNPNLDAALQLMTRACELGDAAGCDGKLEIERALAEGNARVPGANMSVGSATVDGLTVSTLECRIDGAVGMLGSLAIIGALAKRKAKIDACGAAGATADIHWVASGGKITKADGEGKEGACVAKVLNNLSSPLDGECAVTVVIGR